MKGTHSQGTTIDIAPPDYVIVERVLFCVLAVAVWIFILRTLYTAYTTRKSLQQQMDTIQQETRAQQEKKGNKKLD
jgi:cell division protein FtsL